MSLGSLVTLAEYGPENLIVVLLVNRQYEMTGGQLLSSRVDFVALAHAAGVGGGGRTDNGSVSHWATFEEAYQHLPAVLRDPGPHFVVVPVTNSHPLPPVNHSDHAGRVARLRAAIGIG